MMQRAAGSTDNRGPPVPDGPPIETADNKGFSFSRLH